MLIVSVCFSGKFKELVFVAFHVTEGFFFNFFSPLSWSFCNLCRFKFIHWLPSPGNSISRNILVMKGSKKRFSFELSIQTNGLSGLVSLPCYRGGQLWKRRICLFQKDWQISKYPDLFWICTMYELLWTISQ